MLPIYEPQEKPLDWIFRKKHKTSFRNRYACQSTPSNKTPVLYDGSAEARAILQNAINIVDEEQGNMGEYMILVHALDYLKGKDMQGNFSYTQEFFTDLTEWIEGLQEVSKPELVQIAPTEQAEDYPEWNPNNKS